jgi:hypothetical protein
VIAITGMVKSTHSLDKYSDSREDSELAKLAKSFHS